MDAKGDLQVSIIIPTHNRRPRLIAALDAIAQQDFGLEAVEVIVVADGCTDDTAAAAGSYQAPFRMRLLELSGMGPAVARNRGAETARGPLLLFLDDDIEPCRTWLGAHVRTHKRHPGSVVIGSYPPLPVMHSEFRDNVRHWWMQHFDELERVGHRHTWQDVLTGNISLSRRLWKAIGGLDPAFARAREDWELGVRLIAAGCLIIHVPDAFGWHHEYQTLTIRGAIERKRAEGRADVRLGIKHPHIRTTLPIVHYWSTPGLHGHTYRKIFCWAVVGELIARSIAWLADRLSRLQTGGLFHRAMDAAYRAAYLRGAAQELVTVERWRKFTDIGADPPRKLLLLDLAHGLPAAERRLDAERPDVARLMLGNDEIGLLPYAPAAEPWAGRHLRAFLIGPAAAAMLHALRQHGTLMRDRDAQVEPGKLPPKLEINAWAYLGVKEYSRSMAEGRAQWARADNAARSNAR